MAPKPEKPPSKPPSAAAPARPPRPSGGTGQTGTPADGSGKSWMSIIGGLAVLFGVLALIYHLYTEKERCCSKICPRIDPKLRKWPMEPKSWIPWDKIKKLWSSIIQLIRKKSC